MIAEAIKMIFDRKYRKLKFDIINGSQAMAKKYYSNNRMMHLIKAVDKAIFRNPELVTYYVDLRVSGKSSEESYKEIFMKLQCISEFDRLSITAGIGI